MLNAHDILETITMIQEENLDVRTITMGISLLDCCDSDIDKACTKIYHKITDRAKAIEYAVNMAEPGDIVLLAGKGHEDYQLICGRKEPFSERNLILRAADAKKLLI